MTTPKTATSSHRLRSSVHRELSFLWQVLEGWFFCLCFTTEHFSKLCLPSPRSHSCSLSPVPFPVLLFPLSHFLPPVLLFPPQCVHRFPPLNDPFFSPGVFSAGSRYSMFGRFAPVFVSGLLSVGGGWSRSDGRCRLICFPWGEGPGLLPGWGRITFPVEAAAFSCYLPFGSLLSTLEKDVRYRRGHKRSRT